jgi:hypothetical protein
MDLKSNVGNSKQVLDSEKSFFERLESEFKQMIFGVVYQLLQEDEQNYYLSLFLYIV